MSMVRNLPGRVQFIDQDAPGHPEFPIHSVEVASDPVPFVTVWTKGQVEPFRETDHDPHTYHVGDEKLSLVDEVFVDRKYRVAGWKQHFHVRTSTPATLADLEPFRRWIHPDLWAELTSGL